MPKKPTPRSRLYKGPALSAWEAIRWREVSTPESEPTRLRAQPPIPATTPSPSPPCAGAFVQQAHAHAVRLGLRSSAFVGTALVRAYGLCGRADAVAAAFEEIAKSDAVCCPRHACRGGAGEDAPGWRRARARRTWASAGPQLHARACKAGSDSETAACNALITVYLKCGGGMRPAVASQASTDGISGPNTITWTALIAGLAGAEWPCRGGGELIQRNGEERRQGATKHRYGDTDTVIRVRRYGIRQFLKTSIRRYGKHI